MTPNVRFLSFFTCLLYSFSLIDSSRLLSGQNPESFVRVDWVCYLRDEPLIPYERLIMDFQDLSQTGKKRLWIQRRANYLLSLEEVDELKIYIEKHVKMKNSRGPDASTSITTEELGEMVKQIRLIEKMKL